MASNTQRFLVPVFTVSTKNAWHNGLLFVTPKTPGGTSRKNWVGVCSTLPENLSLFQTKICDFPLPSSDLIKTLIPYFRPEVRRVTGAHDKLLRHVLGSWRKH